MLDVQESLGGLRQTLSDVCRRAYARGLVSGCSGNASARAADGFLVTPSGSCLGDMGPDDLVLVDAGGQPVASGAQVGRPTSELPLHLELYGVLAGAGAVLHTHSPAATAFAVAGRAIRPLTTEAEYFLDTVPCVPYAPPGSGELGQSAATAARGRKALLLARHGVVTWGATARDAFFQAELVEAAARVALYLASGALDRLASGDDLNGWGTR